MIAAVEPLPLPHPRHGEIATFDLSPIGEVFRVTGSSGSGWRADLGSAGSVRLPDRIRFPRIAAVAVDAAVVVDARTTSGAVNGWIVSTDGIEAGFFAGDAVQDLIALPDGHIVVTYFDEGFGKPVSEQGAAVFDHRGTLLTGYRRATGEAFIDCYAAVGVGARSVALWTYPDWHLTVWDTEDASVRTWHPPSMLRGASAITHAGDHWWFHSPYRTPHTLLEWRPPSPEVHEVGLVRGPLRGLPGGRFLAESAHTVDGARHHLDGPSLITMESTCLGPMPTATGHAGPDGPESPVACGGPSVPLRIAPTPPVHRSLRGAQRGQTRGSG